MDLECSICSVKFDRNNHLPKILQCGHTFCKECVQNPNLDRKCPHCGMVLVSEPVDNMFAVQLMETLIPSTEHEQQMQQLERGIAAGEKLVAVLRMNVQFALMTFEFEAFQQLQESTDYLLMQTKQALEKMRRGEAGGAHELVLKHALMTVDCVKKMDLWCSICFFGIDRKNHLTKILQCGHTFCEECVHKSDLDRKCPSCGMMDLQCSICFVEFDQDNHRPISLPCGHTICKNCVQNPEFDQKCPSCRKVLVSKPVDNMFAVQLMEKLIPRRERELERLQLERGSAAGEKPVAQLGKVMPTAVQAHKQLQESSANQMKQALEEMRRGKAGAGELVLKQAAQMVDGLRLTYLQCLETIEELMGPLGDLLLLDKDDDSAEAGRSLR